MAMLIVIGLIACATTPQRNDQLEEARARSRIWSEDPEAERAAAEQLRAARNDLQRANAAFAAHTPAGGSDSLRLLAQREAQAGKS